MPAEALDLYEGDRLEQRLKTPFEGEVDAFRNFLAHHLPQYFDREALPGARVLNVGCGYMKEFPAMEGFFKRRTAAVDCNELRIRDVKERYRDDEVEATLGDATKLTEIYRQRLFDLVLLRHPAVPFGEYPEGNPEIPKIIAQIHQVLDDSGIFMSTFHIKEEWLEASAMTSRLNFNIVSEGFNEHALWDFGLKGFYGQDGYFLVARK